jgi:hypothetical protein
MRLLNPIDVAMTNSDMSKRRADFQRFPQQLVRAPDT